MLRARFSQLDLFNLVVESFKCDYKRFVQRRSMVMASNCLPNVFLSHNTLRGLNLQQSLVGIILSIKKFVLNREPNSYCYIYNVFLIKLRLNFFRPSLNLRLLRHIKLKKFCDENFNFHY